ncbi:FadR/GntR family transcriptional regulator [Streptomyces sp. NPDC096324]|uniref:FadR/GntR family transcriptional regulator n=1 Tax=Streptomyces sp. NPDC096324 TaxID=3366085 RepID=UPI00381AC9A6
MQSYARRGVHGRTVEVLAHRVLSGQLPEGATLDIAALRHELGVSLTTLRESLKVLAAKGMVDARQRRGTFVRPRSDWNLLDADVLHWQFTGRRRSAVDVTLLRSLGELRGIVAPAAARLAALRRTDADMSALQSVLSALGEDAGPEQTSRTHQAFHRALLVATHNEVLERMVTVITIGVAQHGHLACGIHPRDESVQLRFKTIVEAVREQDADVAEHAMRVLLAERAYACDTTDPRTPGCPCTTDRPHIPPQTRRPQ